MIVGVVKDVVAGSWSWFIGRTAGLALLEGLVVGLPFSGIRNNAFDIRYWLLMAAIVGLSGFATAVVAYRIAAKAVSRQDAVWIAWIVGALVGFAAGYLLQPTGGPT
jgi:hypothetical protein